MMNNLMIGLGLFLIFGGFFGLGVFFTREYDNYKERKNKKRLEKRWGKTATVILFLFFIFSAGGASAQTVEISLSDLQELRKVAAEREFQAARAADAEKAATAWKTQATEWRGLYENEKIRADQVQGGRVDELLKANAKLTESADELKKANAVYKMQAADDKQRIGELDFENRKLKGERKWYFALGAITGGAAGAYIGYNARSIPNPFGTQNRNDQTRAGGFRFQF